MHAKKNIFIKLLVIASISIVLPASAKNHLLIPYKKANHWGLCDTSGKMIVPATFDSLCQFYLVDNYKVHCKVPYAVFSNGKTITLYQENKMVLQSNQYDSVKIVTYKNDTYLLYKNGLVGLHKDGKKRLDCMYEKIYFESNDRLEVVKNNLHGIVTAQKKIIVPLAYSTISGEEVGESYIWTAKNKSGKFTFTDKNVNKDYPVLSAMTITKNETYNVDSFEKQKKYLLEIKNKLQEIYSVITMIDWESPYLNVANADTLMGIFDYKQWKEIIPTIYDSIGISEGKGEAYFMVAKDGKLGMRNANNEALLQTAYDFLYPSDNYNRILFYCQNNLIGFCSLQANAYPTNHKLYRKIVYFDKYTLANAWTFGILAAIDQQGNFYFVGENGKEYFSKY